MGLSATTGASRDGVADAVEGEDGIDETYGLDGPDQTTSRRVDGLDHARAPAARVPSKRTARTTGSARRRTNHCWKGSVPSSTVSIIVRTGASPMGSTRVRDAERRGTGAPSPR